MRTTRSFADGGPTEMKRGGSHEKTLENASGLARRRFGADMRRAARDSLSLPDGGKPSVSHHPRVDPSVFVELASSVSGPTLRRWRWSVRLGKLNVTLCRAKNRKPTR